MQQALVPGARIWIRRRRWRVDRARAGRHTIRLDVSDRDRRLTLLTPYDVPAPITNALRPRRVRPQQALARLARLVAGRAHARLSSALLGADIDIWAHQLEPLGAVIAGHRRILIADEVGLGKSVQAGLILADAIARHSPLHALVIVPASLRAQWNAELQTRFAIRTDALESLLDRIDTRGGRRSRRTPGIWLASIDYLKQPHVLDGLPLHPWDVVIVDEAHATAGPSDRHQAVDEIGRRARHLVLLTATPHDGDQARFERLLQTGRLSYAGDGLTVFRRTRAEVSFGHGRKVRWVRVAPGSALARLLDALAGYERLLTQRSRTSRHDAALLLLSVFRKRALSTMAALDRSLARRLEWLDSGPFGFELEWLQPSLDFGDDELDDQERTILTVDLGVSRALERTWLRRLRTLARAAMRADPKLAWIARAATRTREPFVLFTEFRHSLEAVERTLRGIRSVGVAHGGHSDAQRQEAIRRFQRGDVSVLVATDVCSQGLNLQACARWAINLELPWNPLRLEQRIGRIDRLGQPHTVHASMLVTGHPAEAGVLASLARRTLRARHASGASSLDALAPPAPLAVASALIENASLSMSEPVTQPLVRCRRFVRHGRAVARIAGRARRLSACWHGSVDGRPVATSLRGRLCTGRGDLVLLAVPILDRTGDIVERCYVACLLQAGTVARTGGSDLAAALIERFDGRLRARLTRLERLRAEAAERRSAAERAIGWHLHRLSYPEEVQLGLFGQRRGADFARNRAQAERLTRRSAERIRLEVDRAALERGMPTLDWIGHGEAAG